MTAPYARRKIIVTFQLGKGSFGGSGSNQLTVKGLRVHVHIERVVLPSPPIAIIRIYGLTLSHMNQLSQAGLQWQQRDNLVAVQAGDDESGMTEVFNGLIFQSYPDFRQMPDTSFVVVANSGAKIQMKPVQPVTFKGATPVATALQRILATTGLKLENNGVSAVLSNPYFAGTAMTQLMSAIRAADCFGFIDMTKKLLAIWPKDKSRQSGGVPEVSPATGMIGYPEFERNLIKVRTLFDPAIHAPSDAAPGTRVKVKSQLTAANGEWPIIKVGYNLMSEMPNGPWEMDIHGVADGSG
jgi:hypothetical protein